MGGYTHPPLPLALIVNTLNFNYYFSPGVGHSMGVTYISMGDHAISYAIVGMANRTMVDRLHYYLVAQPMPWTWRSRSYTIAQQHSSITTYDLLSVYSCHFA